MGRRPKLRGYASLEDRNEAILEARKSGKSVQEVAEQFDLSYATIINAAPGVAGSRRGAAKWVKLGDFDTVEERNAAIRARRNDGLTLQELADEFDLSISHISKMLPASRLQVRHGLGEGVFTYQQRADIMVSRYLAGETLQAIANDWDLTRERVRQIIKEQDPEAWRKKNHRDRTARYYDYLARRKQLIKDRVAWVLDKGRRCKVCWGYNFREPKRASATCSRECSVIWRSAAVRFAIDEDEYARHRIHRAESVLRHADRYREEQREVLVKHAQKVIDGINTTPNRRYFTNSQTKFVVEEIVGPLRDATIVREQELGIRDGAGDLLPRNEWPKDFDVMVLVDIDESFPIRPSAPRKPPPLDATDTSGVPESDIPADVERGDGHDDVAVSSDGSDSGGGNE
jgi:uncharacterized protein (DUF433 family)